ncbi:hypothetical protein GIB67_023693 [Kingdonia uniflora]|uniref:Uncharacterized protein n=1 Tax=Kingdonia uniflora TaxID=39325 RepID=A0A7J7MGA2_9MAGN|nr:hypothetical protein GIB67_023693 [Kingdonia uniflora]
MKKNNKEWFESRIQKYGPVFKTSLMGAQFAILTSRAGTKFVLTTNYGIANNKSASAPDIFGRKSLLDAKGSRHKLLKGAVMNMLKPERLQKFIGDMDIIVKKQMLQLSQSISARSVVEATCLFLGDLVQVGNDSELINMWKFSEVDNLWDVHFYVTPISVSSPIDIVGLPNTQTRQKVLTIDDGPEILISQDVEAPTKSDPIKIPKPRPKVVTPKKTSKKSGQPNSKGKRKPKTAARTTPKKGKVRPNKMPKETLDDLPYMATFSNDEVEVVDDTVGRDEGIGDIGAEGVFVGEEEGTRAVDIDRCDDNIRDIAKECDNIFENEEAEIGEFNFKIHILRELGVPTGWQMHSGWQIKLNSSWNAWTICMERIVGSYDEGYILQPELARKIFLANPGSVVLHRTQHGLPPTTPTVVSVDILAITKKTCKGPPIPPKVKVPS